LRLGYLIGVRSQPNADGAAWFPGVVVCGVRGVAAFHQGRHNLLKSLIAELDVLGIAW
jgi:hypothetical protein